MPLTDILNFIALSDRLGTAGQPTAEQFPDIRAGGFKTVINLAPADNPRALANEADIVAAQGLEYIHIPVAWDAPTSQDLQRFFDAMDARSNSKVFVHCAMNLRVSVFIFLYRVLRRGESRAEAEKALQRAWAPVMQYAKARGPESQSAAVVSSFTEADGVWRRFIDDALKRRKP
jgi:protein tyrosine phosphatase (PTP) superfamily phosphohydrolase (DUF442 family)